jgi:hypothetical protein
VLGAYRRLERAAAEAAAPDLALLQASLPATQDAPRGAIKDEPDA